MRTVLTFLADSPARLMLVAWALGAACYYFGPIEYDVAPSERMLAVAIVYTLTFIVGSWCAPAPWRDAAAPHATDAVGDDGRRRTLQRVVIACAIVGSLGALAMAIDKLFLSGIDYSQGITSVRSERSVQESLGDAGPARSPLLYLGHLTASFGIVAYLLYWLRGDRFSLATFGWANLGLLSSAVLALLGGGRSPLVFSIILVLAATLVRAYTGRALLPQPKLGASSWPSSSSRR